ncbi:hypothetical protein [Amphibacillus indicireducens]|uniref:Phospholipid phosphatase n=1 Tax=Amphibacillus indicireducens TaxID=1076330 RepID=A0ABP7VEL6_9BACI
MNRTIYSLLTISYIVLFIWGIRLFRKQKQVDSSIVLLFVIFGLIYDNLVLSVGRFIGEGQLLENLSYLRFWLHTLFTPLLIIFVWQISKNLRLKWANSEISKVTIFLLTLGLIIYQWYQSIRQLKLEVNWERDVLLYENIVEQKIPFMVLITTAIVGWVGILLWKHQKFYWLFVGTAIMIFGSILTIWLKNVPIMNLFELLFIVSLLLTKKFQLRRTASPFT